MKGRAIFSTIRRKSLRAPAAPLVATGALFFAGCRPVSSPLAAPADFEGETGNTEVAAFAAPYVPAALDRTRRDPKLPLIRIEVPGTQVVHVRIALPLKVAPRPPEAVALAVLDRRFRRIVGRRALATHEAAVSSAFTWAFAAPPSAAAGLARRLAAKWWARPTSDEVAAAVAAMGRSAHLRAYGCATDLAAAYLLGSPETEGDVLRRPPDVASVAEAILRLRTSPASFVLEQAPEGAAGTSPGAVLARNLARAGRPRIDVRAPPPVADAARDSSRNDFGPWAVRTARTEGASALVVARRLALETPKDRALARLAVELLGDAVDARFVSLGPVGLVVIRLRNTPSPPTAIPRQSLERIQKAAARPLTDALVSATARRLVGARIVDAALRWEDLTGHAMEFLLRGIAPEDLQEAWLRETAAFFSIDATTMADFLRARIVPRPNDPNWAVAWCGP